MNFRAATERIRTSSLCVPGYLFYKSVTGPQWLFITNYNKDLQILRRKTRRIRIFFSKATNYLCVYPKFQWFWCSPVGLTKGESCQWAMRKCVNVGQDGLVRPPECDFQSDLRVHCSVRCSVHCSLLGPVHPGGLPETAEHDKPQLKIFNHLHIVAVSCKPWKSKTDDLL